MSEPLSDEGMDAVLAFVAALDKAGKRDHWAREEMLNYLHYLRCQECGRETPCYCRRDD